MNYFDTSYIVRLYYEDPGWEAVRALAALDQVGCCVHGRIETLAAFHRKLREGALSTVAYRELRKQFDSDCAAGAFKWLLLSENVSSRAASAFSSLPASVYLRTADAIHLACAAENAFSRVYSNDRQLLAAATQFGIDGVNVC